MTAACTGHREEWRDVPGYEGRYQASTLGRVRSLPRRCVRGGLMRGTVVPRGYRSVSLTSADGVQLDWRVNRLIAWTFYGPPEPGHVCRHLNGDRLDNRLVNLRWGTHVENVADTVAMGRHGNGSKTHCKWGHEYTPENTHFVNESSGRLHRRCRACSRLTKKRYKTRRQERRAA